MNKPLDDATSCAECHADMYEPVDIFEHATHVEALGGNDGCAECHGDGRLPKVRQNTTGCAQCHQDMRVADSRVQPVSGGHGTEATGYTDALHGLCTSCHQEQDAAHPGAEPPLGECATCHSTRSVSDADTVLDARQPSRPSQGRR